MQRLLALSVFLLVLPAQSAAGDGCIGPCNGRSLALPGTSLIGVRPFGEGGPLQAWRTTDGALAFELPNGLATADGRGYYASEPPGKREWSTSLSRFDPRSGRRLRSWRVGGRWWLSGVSPTGRYLTLTMQSRRPRPTTVGIVDTRTGRVGRVVRLPGRYEVETISADGRRLFLIQYLGRGERYAIRLYDVARGSLRGDALKGPGEPRVMTGFAWNAVASPDGRWLLTLYVNVGRRVAFVHALDLVRSEPRCIFLPSQPRRGFNALSRYSLTLSPDGRRAFAANPALGAVAEIDLGRRAVARTARFRPERMPLRRLPQTTNGVVSGDGRLFYFTGARSVWAFDGSDGRVRGPYRTGGPVIGLGLGSRERVVHALLADRRMVRLDAATGRPLAG